MYMPTVVPLEYSYSSVLHTNEPLILVSGICYSLEYSYRVALYKGTTSKYVCTYCNTIGGWNTTTAAFCDIVRDISRPRECSVGLTFSTIGISKQSQFSGRGSEL